MAERGAVAFLLKRFSLRQRFASLSVKKNKGGKKKKKKAVVIVPLHAALRKSYLSLRAADQEPGPIGIFFLHRPFKNTDQDG